VNEALTLA